MPKGSSIHAIIRLIRPKAEAQSSSNIQYVVWIFWTSSSSQMAADEGLQGGDKGQDASGGKVAERKSSGTNNASTSGMSSRGQLGKQPANYSKLAPPAISPEGSWGKP